MIIKVDYLRPLYEEAVAICVICAKPVRTQIASCYRLAYPDKSAFRM